MLKWMAPQPTQRTVSTTGVPRDGLFIGEVFGRYRGYYLFDQNSSISLSDHRNKGRSSHLQNLQQPSNGHEVHKNSEHSGGKIARLQFLQQFGFRVYSLAARTPATPWKHH